jgi:hypothetical protein
MPLLKHPYMAPLLQQVWQLMRLLLPGLLLLLS